MSKNWYEDSSVVKEHKTHDFVEMVDEKKRLFNVFSKKVKNLETELERKRENFYKVKQDIGNRNSSCLAELKASKIETLRKITKTFDEKINLVADFKNEMDKKIQGEIVSLDHKLKWIMRVKNTDATMARHVISSLLSQVILLAKESEKDLSEYYIYDRNPAEEDAERMCGNINPQKKSIHDDSTMLKSPVGSSDPHGGTSVIQNKMPTLKRPSDTQKRSIIKNYFIKYKIVIVTSENLVIISLLYTSILALSQNKS